MSRKSLLIAVITLVVVIGGGAGAYVYFNPARQNIAKFEATSKSPQNIIAEEYFPSDMMLVASLNLQDKEMRENLNYLMSVFPGSEELKAEFHKGFLEGWNQNANAWNVDFEQDVRPVLGNESRMVVGLSPTNENRNGPDVYAAFNITDSQALENLKQKLVQSEGFQEEDYKGTKLLQNAAEHFYAAPKGDVLFITNLKENLTAILDTTDDKNSIYADATYKQVLSQLDTPHLAYVYINFPLFTELIQKTATELEPAQKLESDTLEMFKGFGMSLAAKRDGLAIKGYVLGDQAVMDRLEYKFSSVANRKPYLIEKLPVSNTIFYEEVYNLKKLISDSFRVNQSMYGEFAQEFGNVFAMAKVMLQSNAGIDLEKDVFDLFDQGFAASLQFERENLMPALTLLIDAKNHAASAEKLVGLIDQNMDVWLKSIQAESGSNTFVVKEKIKLAGKDVNRIKVNVTELLEKDPSLPAVAKDLVKKTTVQFAYGQDGEGTLVLSTVSNLENAYLKNSLKEEVPAKEALARIAAQNQGIFYLNISSLLAYVDQVVAYIDKVEPMSESDKESYDKVVNAIRPVKYLIFSSHSGDYDSTSTGFIRIGE